jgi:hypothetical protein
VGGSPCEHPDEAVDANALAAVVGPIHSLERTPLKTVGYTARSTSA